MLIANALYIVVNYKTSVVSPLISQIFTSFMFFLHCFSFPQNRVLSVSKGYLIRLERGQSPIPFFATPVLLRRLSSLTIGAHVATAERTTNRKSNPLKQKGKTQWEKSLEQTPKSAVR